MDIGRRKALGEKINNILWPKDETNCKRNASPLQDKQK